MQYSKMEWVGGLRHYISLARMKTNMHSTTLSVYACYKIFFKEELIEGIQVVWPGNSIISTHRPLYTHTVCALKFERSFKSFFLKLDHGYHAQLASIWCVKSAVCKIWEKRKAETNWALLASPVWLVHAVTWSEAGSLDVILLLSYRVMLDISACSH